MHNIKKNYKKIQSIKIKRQKKTFWNIVGHIVFLDPFNFSFSFNFKVNE
jgi:hypothetical protein